MEKPKLDIDISVGGISVRGELQDDLTVGDGDINKHMDEVSIRLLWWSTQAIGIEKELNDKQTSYKVWLAQMKVAEGSAGRMAETAKEDMVISKHAEEYLED